MSENNRENPTTITTIKDAIEELGDRIKEDEKDPSIQSSFPMRKILPGNKRHTSGRQSNPHIGQGEEVRGLRDEVDPIDPQTMPGEVRIRHVAPSIKTDK